MVTCGITHAISMFADMWLDPGDVVISPDMMWGNYNMILSVKKGATITQFPLFTENGELGIRGGSGASRAPPDRRRCVSDGR